MKNKNHFCDISPLLCCVVALSLLFGAVYHQYSSMYADSRRRCDAAVDYIVHKEYRKAANACRWAIVRDKSDPAAYGMLQALHNSIYVRNRQEVKNLEKQAAANKADMEAVTNYRVAFSAFIQSDKSDIITDDGKTFAFLDNASRPAYEYTYNNGDIASIRNYEYSENGLLTKDTLTYCDSDRPTVTSQYFYDNNNVLIKKQTRDTSAGYSYTTFHYDNNEIVKIDYGSQYAVYHSDYYKNSRLYRRQYLREPDYLNHTTDFSDYFDESGRKTKTIYNDGYRFEYTVYTYIDNMAESHTYYNDGLLKEYTKTTSDESGKKTVLYKKYNRFGEVVKETLTVGSIVKSVTRPTDNIINPRPLTQEELNKANNSKLQYFVQSAGYETSENIVLFDVISACTDKTNLLTDDDKYELSLLKAEGVDIDFERIETDNGKYYKTPYNTVNQMLNSYMNLSVADLRIKSVYPNSGAVYSEKCNAFYIPYNSGFIKNRRYEFIGGIIGDNVAKLYTPNYTLTLINENGRYIVTSCIKEDHSDLVTEQDASENRSNSKPLILKDVFLHTDSTKSTAYNNAMSVFNRFIADRCSSVSSDEIKENRYAVKNYYLYDLTSDGVPELISRYDDAFAPYDVYMCINNTLKHVGRFGGYGGDGGITFLKNGMIMGQLYKISFKSYDFFTVNNDGSVTAVSFSRETDYYDRDVTHYIFDDKEITRDEYIRLTKKYFEASDHDAPLQKIELFQ